MLLAVGYKVLDGYKHLHPCGEEVNAGKKQEVTEGKLGYGCVDNIVTMYR